MAKKNIHVVPTGNRWAVKPEGATMETAQIYKAFTAFFALMTVSAVAIVLRPDSELAPVFVSLAPVFVMEPWLAPKRLIHRLYRDSLLFRVR